jgi:hypothetical protein
MINQSELKEIMHYDPGTGIFRWKVTVSRNVKAGSIAGSRRSDGYWRVPYKGKIYSAHRLAWFYVHGVFPPDQVDHINHQRDDNRIANLRLATNTENGRNRSLSTNNTSGVTGVYWEKREGKWRATIKANGKRIHLGCFYNIECAIAARQAANIKYKFHRNHGIELSQQENQRGHHD